MRIEFPEGVQEAFFAVDDVATLVRCPRCLDWLDQEALYVHDAWCRRQSRDRY